MRVALNLLACVLVGVVPLLRPVSDAPAESDFPGWPATWEGRALREVPPAPREAVMLARLPGRTACFTDGERSFVLRWLRAPSPDVHPAARCFRGAGFAVTPLDAVLDAHDRLWGRFRAERDGEALVVRERVFDERGRSWPDVSSFYWSRVFTNDAGPWWSVLVAEPVD